MSIKICEECSYTFSPYYASHRFCSRTCANQSHKRNMQAAGEQQRALNANKYYINPVICQNCSSAIPYRNKRVGKFCSRSCAATFQNRIVHSNKPNKPKKVKNIVQKRPVKSWSKICPITGQTFIDQNEYRNREWSPYPNGRIQTIQLLASAFNITLGQPDTSERLTAARSTIQEAYVNDQLSTLEIHKKFNWSCTPGHVSNFLKALNISRRSLSQASAMAITAGRAASVGHGYKSGYHLDWSGQTHYYRSSYELKYYQILDDAKLPYQTESIHGPYYDSVLNKDRIAIPDIIIDNRIILEVKSSWTYNKPNMIDKVISYKFNGFDVILGLDFKDYIINSPADLP